MRDNAGDEFVVKLCKKCWQMKNHIKGKCGYCEGKKAKKKELEAGR